MWNSMLLFEDKKWREMTKKMTLKSLKRNLKYLTK